VTLRSRCEGSTQEMKWGIGPLSFPTTEDWKYWIPTTPEGTVRAWYFPTGLPSRDDELLGEFSTTKEAQEACRLHKEKPK
jgi:hypothetical protein